MLGATNDTVNRLHCLWCIPQLMVVSILDLFEGVSLDIVYVMLMLSPFPTNFDYHTYKVMIIIQLIISVG